MDEQKEKSIADQLKKRFDTYKTANLKSIGPDEFCVNLESRIGATDAQSEGFSENDLPGQRKLSIEFTWGHNHDFGDFELKGRMKDRHIKVLARFLTLFDISIKDFKGKQVFDIGCWTGGTTLLLASLGCHVFAVEEVKKYADTIAFLVQSFGIDDRVCAKPLSIYDCNCCDYHDRFDIAFFPGVIYHLSDPVLALRIIFNSLRVGGIVLIESAGINVDEAYCKFVGNSTAQQDRKSGWAWFWPSPSALERMAREAGFDEIQMLWHETAKRVYGYARKNEQRPICKAGLAVRDIR